MLKTRTLFTPGPVPIEKHILDLGAQQLFYNRTQEFSQLTNEIVEGLGYVFQTSGETAILTGSGTAAMEAAVLNFLGASDHVLIINGGTFGQRWCDLCQVHSINHSELKVEAGDDVDIDLLAETISQTKYTALLINAHETSTGHLYDIEAIGRLARKSGLLFVVDAISSICADRFLMDDWHVDVALLSSQKALALPPGLAFVAMSAKAQSLLMKRRPKTLYLNLQNYIINQQRGQSPYTPAIGLYLQLHQRLRDIKQETLDVIVNQHNEMANRFRNAITSLGFETLATRPSNALTAVVCKRNKAFEIVQTLRDDFHIEVAPSGGELKYKIFRVSHMGAIKNLDVDSLISALKKIVV